jgi:hypothetical protein
MFTESAKGIPLMLKKFSFGASMLCTFILAGCGGGGPSGSATLGKAMGIYLTDAPLLGAESVIVSVSKIEALAQGGGFVDTGIPAFTVDLLTLRNTEQLLGTTQLPIGQYQGLRLTLEEASITVDGETHPLKPVQSLGGAVTPEGKGANAAQGKFAEAMARHAATVTVKPNKRSATLLVLGSFTVDENGSASPLLMDFNVAYSVVETGKGDYLLKPVIPLVRKDQAGEVAGEIDLGENAEEVEVEVVVARPDKKVANAGVADPQSKGGKFRVAALPQGSYTVTVTAQGRTDVILPNITITPGQRMDLGKIVLPRP